MKRPAPLLALVLLFASVVTLPASARRGSVTFYATGSRAPRFATVESGRPFMGPPVTAALDFLGGHVARFGIRSPAKHLDVLEVSRSEDRTLVRFGQSVSGVPVWGAQYLVHLERASEGFTPVTVNGHIFTELDPPAKAAFPRRVAEQLARVRARSMVTQDVLHRGLTVLPIGRGVLAYHLILRGEFLGRPVSQEMFINALTGTVALTYNNLQPDGPTQAPGQTTHGEQVTLDVFERSPLWELRDVSKPMFASHGGEITTHDIEGRSRYLATVNNLVTSPEQMFDGKNSVSGAVDAHLNASRVYDFYYELGRDSLDGQGGSIVSSVNASENGEPMYNAFWDGVTEQMVYGNPDPSQFHPFSASLDVVGHELTHGVTQYTGNLAYINQSGAMNEAYSDYFGNAIDVRVTGTPMDDPEAGYLGEALCKRQRSEPFTCPLRDLNDGTTAADYIYFLADLDNGGVHLNSTIYGGTLWDIREALGEAADRYIYQALAAYTTPIDTFVDGRNSILAAADELGASDSDKAAIQDAFDARGLVDGWDAASASDAVVLMEDVAPVTNVGFSEPQLDGDRFAIGDYADKAQICCSGLQIFSGTLTGSESPEQVSPGEPSTTISDESPDVAGNRVVWSRIHLQDAQPAFADIVSRIGSEPMKKLYRSGGLAMNPSMDGRLVAWESIGGNTDIQARYVGGRVRTLAGGRGDQLMPFVDGDWVAWWDQGPGLPRVEAVNVRTGKRHTVEVGRACLQQRGPCSLIGPPSVRGHHLLWYQDKKLDGVGSIRSLDLRSGARSVLVPESSSAAPVWVLGLTNPPVPSTNGRFVVYSTELNYALEFALDSDLVENDQVGRDIFIVPIGGGNPELVTNDRADQAFPLLGSRRRVMFLDSSHATTDLVIREVP